MQFFYPLTYAQRNIWNIEKFFPDISINNITGTLRFKEELDFKILEQAVNLLIKKNDALRIRITIQNGEPVQYIGDYQFYPLNFIDLSCESDHLTFFNYEEKLTHTPLPIITSELFYIAYFKLLGETALFFKFHHLIADAWSLTLIADNILFYYLRLKNNEKIDIHMAPSYIDYVLTETDYLGSEKFNKSKFFWQKKIETIPEFIYLKNRPSQYSTKSKRISFLISEEISLKIDQYCKKYNISIFVLFSAIFSIYINRTTSKKDIILGTTVLNRLDYKEKNTIGMFVNTLPIRLNTENISDFSSYVGNVYLEWKRVLRHQRYPFDLILKDYRQKNQINGDLFDVTITFQNAVLDSIKDFNKVKGRWHPNEHQTNSLHIHINNRENSNNYVVNLDYLIELFTAEEIKAIYHHLINLLVDALNHPTVSITNLELLSKKEKHKLLYEFNNPQGFTRYESRLDRLFEKQVDKAPENIAVRFGSQQITYQELDMKANLLANYLISEMKVAPDSLVGVFIDRSIDMIICILGILKAGGAYVPIDTQLPEERIKFIFNDSAIRTVLSSQKYSIVLNRLKTDCKFLQHFVWMDCEDTISFISANYSCSRPDSPINSFNLAYVIYTSGSTGIPKGVMVEHHSVCNFLFSMYYAYHQDIDEKDQCLNLTSISFDVSVCEIFLPLCFGASLILLEPPKLEDINLLADTIIHKNITFAYIPPAILMDLYDLLLKFGKKLNLNKLLVGVEPIKDQVLENYLQLNKSMKIINGYGPTEATVCATFYHYKSHKTEGKIVPIGKPLLNSKIYLLDAYNMLVPIGVGAELCISGAGLARGYLNKVDLTEEKFGDNPFISGEKMYRTGDLARWLPDGNIEFIGRIDNQVKVRGFRIELGELESWLKKHEYLKEAIAVYRNDINGIQCLCVYFVAEKKLKSRELKKYLARFLPNYMIPSYFIQLEKIPLTSNGKIDRKSLPEPEIKMELETTYVPPRNKVEEILANIWQEVLNIPRIGVGDNFFDLGGDSLTIIRLLAIANHYQWNLNIKDIYDFPTIEELAGKIIANNYGFNN